MIRFASHDDIIQVRNIKLEEIRMRRAAITLQRSWRQYKVLQAQSKKKKKGKKK